MLRWIFSRVMAPEGDGGASGDGSGDGDGNSNDGGDGKGGEGEGAKTILDSASGAGDGATGAEGAGDGKEGEWSWGENVPGSGTVPPWLKGDKYKTVADQAKAVPELEALIGPAAEMLGAPEENYELPEIPEGIEGEWNAADPMLVKFMEVAKEAGLSQVAFNKLVGPMAQLIGEETTAKEVAVSDALAEIGTNSAARIEQVETYLNNLLGVDAYKPLNDAIGTDVQAYLALEAIVAKASGDAQLSSLPGKQGPGFTKEDIEAEQYKKYPSDHKLAGQSMYDTNKEHRAKVDGMWKELFPGKDTQEVG